MGSSHKGERKKRARLALSCLKKAAVVVAVLDLILAIYDMRSVGRFFLLLTMSTTFDVSPENVIRDHCRGNLEGICETYARFATADFNYATGNRGGSRGGGGYIGRAYTEKNWAYQQGFPQMFKELVMSWKSMFDQSRADANISFYYDYGERGMHEQQPSSSSQSHFQSDSASFEQAHMINRKQGDVFSNDNQKISPTIKPNSYINNNRNEASPLSVLHADFSHSHLRNGSINSHTEVEGDSTSTTNFPLGPGTIIQAIGRKKRELLSNRENAETGNRFGTPKPFLNANSPSKDDGGTTVSTVTTNSGGSTTTTTPPKFQSKPTAKVTTTTTTNADRTVRRDDSMTKQHDKTATIPATKKILAVSISASDSTSQELNTVGQADPRTSESFTTKASQVVVEKAGEKVKPLTEKPQPPQTSSTSPKRVETKNEKVKKSPSMKKQQDHHSIKNKNTCKAPRINNEPAYINKIGGAGTIDMVLKTTVPSSSSSFFYQENFGKMMRKGPKKLMGFIQEELFTQWLCLLENVQNLLEQKNMSSLQLESPEASKIKMHIEVRPFGPDPFKDSEKRLKATQQMLFDYPWLTMLKLHSSLSETFTKMFIVVSLYTWLWGSIIALMLLVGSITEDQTTLHGWIIFNILNSFLMFMIDDWTHRNVDPDRSSVSIWFFIIYSLYKPLAAWIGFSQWFEMKKIHQDDVGGESGTSFLGCLNNMKGSRAGSSSSSGKSSCNTISSIIQASISPSEGTTKDTTIVDILSITPSPTLTFVSTQPFKIIAENPSGPGVIEKLSHPQEVEIEEDFDEDEEDGEGGGGDEDDYDDDDDDDSDSDEEIRDQEKGTGTGGGDKD